MSQKGVIVYSTSNSIEMTTNLSKDDNNNESLMSSSPIAKDNSLYHPWRWSDSAQSIQLSPVSNVWTGSSYTTYDLNSSSTKRGRPRLEEITGLILSGSTSPSAIKCEVCNRVFPREKSLQAHMRTHTGERPYKCDFSDCGRAFAQSGQLRTHQRLHTGEKPFICAQNGCSNRFTHANRRCGLHPRSGVRRIIDQSDDEQNSSANKVLKVNKNIGNTENNCKKLEKKTKTEKRKDSKRRSVISHVGRAARKLHKELDAEADNQNDMSEHREKIMGALALMELAGSAPIEIGSEISINGNENDEQIPITFLTHI